MILVLLTQLLHAHEVSGQIQLEGTPIANSAVYLFDVNQQYRESRSNQTGFFSFNDVPDGPYRLFAVPDITTNAIPAFYPNTPQYCDGEQIQVTSNTEININLEAGAEIEATLLVEGEPIVGALLKMSPDGGWVRGGFSDENGSVRIAGLPEQSLIVLEVEGDSIPTQWVNDDMMPPSFGYDEGQAAWLDQADIDGFTLELNPGISIGGLVHSGPTPIANANLSVYSNSQIRNTQSDEDGLYFVEGLPPGEVLSWMNADGYGNTYSPSDDRPLYFEPILTEGDDYNLLDIDAPLESTISITLLDADTEEPILGASILLYNDTKTVGRGQPVDDNGTAEIVGLHGGQYTAMVYAENDGYYNGDIEDALGEPIWIEVGEEDQTELTVYWEPREQALIDVVDDLGNPVSNVLLLLQHTESDDYDRQYSDGDGIGLMYGLQNGEWELVVGHTPMCPNDMGYVIPTMDPITIPQDADIEVVLLRDHDQDGMPTAWEEEWGLDPYSNDADEDADGDGISNLQEYIIGSEPTSPDAPTECGCEDSKAALVLLPSLFWIGRRRRG